MESVLGLFTATTRCISGVSASEYSDKNNVVIDSIRKRCDDFLEKTGRRPRMLVTQIGQDGNDHDIKVNASSYANLGFDVDISPMFQTPEEAAKMAVENDVHIVGASNLATGHQALIPALIKEMKRLGADDIIVVAGGVRPGDCDYFYDKGIKAAFGPGTPIPESADKILQLIEKKYK